MRKMLWAVCVSASLVFAASGASAGTKDKWITTKVSLALMTEDGLSVKGTNVDTVDGNVTIHGKVYSEADKVRAEETAKKVGGVRSVKNLLVVVTKDEKEAVEVADDQIKLRAEAELKGSRAFKDIKIASVNKGVVLLKGEADSLDTKLKAVEAVYKVDGVDRVATEIRTVED
jgi:osmotically-inducible protein OsmY